MNQIPARLMEYLAKLAEREAWPVDELPDGGTRAILFRLDELGLVCARHVIGNNPAQYPGDPTPYQFSPTREFSPCREPEFGGNWERVLAVRTRDAANRPAEVLLTEAGHVALELPQGKRGPKRRYQKAKDQTLLAQWRDAKAAGISRSDFCEDEGITVQDLKRVQARQRDRDQRAQ